MYVQHQIKDVKYNTRDWDEEGYHAATATAISTSATLVSSSPSLPSPLHANMWYLVT
jgi:hypothetical protein